MGENNKFNYDRILVDNHIISNSRLIGDNNCSVIAICDGVNGKAGSDAAANIVITNLLVLSEKTNSDDVIHSLNTSRKEIQEIQNRDSKYNGISTTIAELVFTNGEFIALNIGDTRIYRLNNKGLKLLTRDHTVAQQKLDCGIANKNNIPDKDYNTLIRYIGNSASVCRPSIKRGFIKTGDTFLLCSDGIYKYVIDDDLKKILKSNLSLEEKERTIMKHALQNGSNDDLSIVILEVA